MKQRLNIGQALSSTAAFLGVVLVICAGGMGDAGTATLGQCMAVGALGVLALGVGALGLRMEE